MAISFGNATVSSSAFSKAQEALSQALESLGTGRRVNKAADDPGALAIGMRLEADERTLGAARSNIDSGQAALKIADSVLGQQQSLLIRANGLAAQAANGILGDADRAAINDEFQAVVAEIDRSGSNASFGGLELLGGTTATDVNVHVGTGGAEADDVTTSIEPSTASSLTGTDASTGATVAVSALDISTAAGAKAALDVLPGAFSQVGDNRANVGAAINRLGGADRAVASQVESTAAASGRIVAQDVAQGAATLRTAGTLSRFSLRVAAIQNQQRGAILDVLV